MHHDWHSAEYVADWIVHDMARDPERRPRLQSMLAAAPFPRDAAIEVLDVGAGYGAVTEEVLKAFPQARVHCRIIRHRCSAKRGGGSPATRRTCVT
jgi:trans-aconitate methyltransferase